MVPAEAEVLDYELCLYDTQGAAVVGLKNDFFASARLDNLLSCYLSVEALLQADGENTCLAVCNDHEEDPPDGIRPEPIRSFPFGWLWLIDPDGAQTASKKVGVIVGEENTNGLRENRWWCFTSVQGHRRERKDREGWIEEDTFPTNWTVRSTTSSVYWKSSS